MKKILLTVLLLVIIGAIAIFIAFLPPNIVYATDIMVFTNKLVLEVGDNYYLTNNNYVIFPSSYTERPVFSCTDETVVTVGIFDGKITANQIGKCKIIITVKTSETETKIAKIEVEVIEKRFYPTEVFIDKTNLNMFINQSVVLNTNIIGTTNILPVVETVDNCVVYDFINDTITGVKVGSDILTITYTLADQSTKTFEISVIVNEKSNYIKSITINKETQSYVYLEYLTNSSKDECSISVTSGYNIVEIVEHEYKHFAVKPLKSGKAVIVVDSPTATNTFYLTII